MKTRRVTLLLCHGPGLMELYHNIMEKIQEEEDRLTSLLPFEMQLVTCDGSKVNESVYQIEKMD
jgi:hypothetical protein